MNGFRWDYKPNATNLTSSEGGPLSCKLVSKCFKQPINYVYSHIHILETTITQNYWNYEPNFTLTKKMLVPVFNSGAPCWPDIPWRTIWHVVRHAKFYVEQNMETLWFDWSKTIVGFVDIFFGLIHLSFFRFWSISSLFRAGTSAILANARHMVPHMQYSALL